MTKMHSCLFSAIKSGKDCLLQTALKVFLWENLCGNWFYPLQPLIDFIHSYSCSHRLESTKTHILRWPGPIVCNINNTGCWITHPSYVSGVVHCSSELVLRQIFSVRRQQSQHCPLLQNVAYPILHKPYDRLLLTVSPWLFEMYIFSPHKLKRKKKSHRCYAATLLPSSFCQQKMLCTEWSSMLRSQSASLLVSI